MTTPQFQFKVNAQLASARLSTLTTPHGSISGPFFQFVATQAAIRGLVYAQDLEKLNAQIVLANTYHLHLRPGEDNIAEANGLHGFMQWSKPITTDSGGYQVFSLSQHLKLDADGVTFRSLLDGASHRLTPASAIQIQTKLGADIIMPLDVCTPFGAGQAEVAQAAQQTFAWAKLCQAEHARLAPDRKNPQALYGIVQGGIYPELRKKAAEQITSLGFFGYSIGGEMRDSKDTAMEEGVAMTTQHLPQDAPRYLMGAGSPADIVRAVRNGVDQFDTVLPIRNARHGKLYLNLNKEELTKCLTDPDRPVKDDKLYQAIDIRKSEHAANHTPFAPDNPAISKPYTFAYLQHLMRCEAPSGYRLAVLNNIHFYVQLMQSIRDTIAKYQP